MHYYMFLFAFTSKFSYICKESIIKYYSTPNNTAMNKNANAT